MNNASHISSAPHSSSLRLFRRKEGEGCWFVTKSLKPRKPVLKGRLADLICRAFQIYADQAKIHLGAFVIMPDHWHLLLGTRDGLSISRTMMTINHWISRESKNNLGDSACGWQEGFYETRIRSLRQFQYVRTYIETNPVKAGLAPDASGWEWSTANDKWKRCVANPWPVKFEQD